ncbi:MAG: penicillin-binding protein [Oscillospiraceae bacterium]|nr:penicillin-binding protein [Oscillospiraceae bacterium]
MDRIIKPWRLAALIILIISLTAIYFVSLYRLQIIEGAAYYEQSENSIVTTNTVVAARGNILDRYGRVLVSNSVCNNLYINADELFEQPDPNAVILELVQAVKDSGNTYADTLPITATAPFEYVPNMTDLQRTRLDAYFEANDLPTSTTAVELMAFFRDAFNIDNNYTSEQMRIVTGVRYEIKIRYVINTSDYVFAEDVSIDLITKLMENNIPGFTVQSSYIRDYNTDYAAHLLGYVGMMNEAEYKEYRNDGYPLNAMVGKEGAEKAFESYLHGTDGTAVVTTTQGGTIISTKYTKEPEPGNQVYLTIDLGLQEAAEISLNNFIADTNKQRVIDNAAFEAQGNTKDVKDMITGGAVVAINVKTGEPLCIASAPTFNLSTLMDDYDALIKDKSGPLFNRALNGAYAPGSTFKPVTAIAALNEGIVTTATTIYDEGIFKKYAEYGYAPTCWLYPHGSHGDVNAAKAIEVSCNYYFYTVGDLLGIDRLSDYALRFGLGTSTGIELSESTGIMATQKYKEETTDTPWYNGDTLQAAIGQSFSVFTPLQLANYIATLANNGTRYEARMLKAARSYDYSESVYERTAVVADTVSVDQTYYDAVHTGMYNVANSADGTAYSVFGSYPYKVAAKTGTAQLGEAITNNGVFVCYAPYDDPQIAIAVVVEKGGAGSKIASIARDVLDYYFSFKNSSISLETENSLLK